MIKLNSKKLVILLPVIFAFIITCTVYVVTRKPGISPKQPTIPNTNQAAITNSDDNFITRQDLVSGIPWQEVSEQDQILSRRGIGWNVWSTKEPGNSETFIKKLPGKEYNFKRAVKNKQDLEDAYLRGVIGTIITGSQTYEGETVNLSVSSWPMTDVQGYKTSESKIIHNNNKLQIVATRIIQIQNDNYTYPYEVEYRAFISDPFLEKELIVTSPQTPQPMLSNFDISEDGQTIQNKNKSITLQLEDFKSETGLTYNLFSEVKDHSSTNKLIILIQSQIDIPDLFIYDLESKKIQYIGLAEEVSLSPKGTYLIYNSRVADAGPRLKFNAYKTETGEQVDLNQKLETRRSAHENFVWVNDSAFTADYYKFDDIPNGSIIEAGERTIDLKKYF